MQEPKKNLKEHPDLYKRSIKGGYWVFALQIVTQLLGIVRSIVVLNLLLGLNLKVVVIANMVIAALNTFSESGFRAALVQKRGDIESYLDTAWVIGIIRGIILYVIVFLAAPILVPHLVTEDAAPLAVSVIRIMGCSFLLHAFENIGIIYFQRELQFGKKFWLSIGGNLTRIAVTLVLILIYRDIWIIVIAHLASGFITLVLSYILCPYRPQFYFVPRKARELWGYGKWLFGTNFVGYLLNEGDDWFVGFYLGADTLTLYSFAFRFSQMPVTHITKLISQVSFPAYSKIQQDIPRLRNAYLKVLRSVGMVSIPTIFLIVILCPDFVKLFLVEKSHLIIPVIQIFAVKGLFRSLGSTRVPLLSSVGKPKYLTYLMGLRVVILSLLIYPLTKKWGMSGAASCFVVINLVIEPISIFVIARTLRMKMYQLWIPSILPLIASFIMLLLIFSAKLIFTSTTLLRFVLLIILGLTVYSMCLWILDRFFEHDFRKLILEQVGFIHDKAIKFRLNTRA